MPYALPVHALTDTLKKARRQTLALCADLTPERSFVVHAGTDRYPIAEGVEAIGLGQAAAMLRTA